MEEHVHPSGSVQRDGAIYEAIVAPAAKVCVQTHLSCASKYNSCRYIHVYAALYQCKLGIILEVLYGDCEAIVAPAAKVCV
jgi:hypothetical protein